MSNSNKFEITFLKIIGASLLVLALSLVSYDAYFWLRHSESSVISMREALVWLDTAKLRGWLSSPNDWLGLWKLLDWLPLSFVSFSVGYNMAIRSD